MHSLPAGPHYAPDDPQADIEAARKQRNIDADWTAARLARHTQAVLEGGVILAKATGDPDLAGTRVDHLIRFVRGLFGVGPNTSETGLLHQPEMSRLKDDGWQATRPGRTSSWYTADVRFPALYVSIFLIVLIVSMPCIVAFAGRRDRKFCRNPDGRSRAAAFIPIRSLGYLRSMCAIWSECGS